MNPIISIASYKGGEGKTLMALNLGTSLAAAGYRVLLVDGDPKESLSRSVGMREKCDVGLVQVVRGEAGEGDIVLDSDSMPLSMLHLGIRSPVDVFYLTHGSRKGRLSKLGEHLQAVASGYDLTIVDTAGDAGPLNAALLASSGSVIIPVTCRAKSVKALPLLLDLLSRIRDRVNGDFALLGLVLSMFDANNPYDLDVLSVMKGAFPPGTFFSTVIPYSLFPEKADCRSVPATFLVEAESLKRVYDNLAREVIQRLEIHEKGCDNDELSEQLF